MVTQKQVLGIDYPFCDCRFITVFVTVFATVIAITKDMADMQGDLQYNIQTFATQLGADRLALLGKYRRRSRRLI